MSKSTLDLRLKVSFSSLEDGCLIFSVLLVWVLHHEMRTSCSHLKLVVYLLDCLLVFGIVSLSGVPNM
ncbi:unnamed protein product [Brassica napus]|uniref:(rape) hypothetical protein n=1 Tax=Brassica napus TaxID=3708 RepID=A0A816P8F7_BRANA|nr:unnamed protein product [Brassica napus]